jgi:L-asparaginase
MRTVRLALITTGGTIAERSPSGARHHLDGAALVSGLAGTADLQIQVHDLFDLPSTHLGFAEMRAIAQAVHAAIEEGAHGVIVTHGTDTLEETAYFVDLLCPPGPPVALTGAMLPPGVTGFDGEANLRDAITVARDRRSRDLGALVVMAGEVHAARDVVKQHTMSLGAFKSPEFGPLGTVDHSRLHLARRLVAAENLPFPETEPVVEGVKCYAGMSDLLVRAAAERGCAGLVLEAMGSGQVPPQLMPAVRDAVRAGVAVVAAARSSMGRLLRSTDAAPVRVDGDEWDLREAGVIFSGLPGTKARIKLQLALGAALPRDALKDRFERCAGAPHAPAP